MAEFNNQISWYAKHMANSLNEIIDKKNNFDFVIEVLDARAPLLTHNDELTKIFNNKVFIQIALKKDLAIINNQLAPNVIYASTKEKGYKNLIINQINNALKTKKESLLKKGMVNPTFCGIVIGIPNTGKSSLINYLANKKVVISQNKPGVTRKISNIKISDGLYLMDTPGIFFKKIENYLDAIKLALINCINVNQFDKSDLAQYCYQNIILKNNYLINELKIENKNLEFNDFVNQLCQQKGFLFKENQFDLERCYQFIFDISVNNPKVLIGLDSL